MTCVILHLIVDDSDSKQQTHVNMECTLVSRSPTHPATRVTRQSNAGRSPRTRRDTADRPGAGSAQEPAQALKAKYSEAMSLGDLLGRLVSPTPRTTCIV